MTDLIKRLSEKESFNYDETFSVYSECSKALVLDELVGSRMLIHILGFRNKFSKELDYILADLTESIGFYPYLQMEGLGLRSTSSNIRMTSSRSPNIEGKFFHDEQKNVLGYLRMGKNLIVSAPTSFGKSLLIEEVIASGRFKNIVVIQPTLALLDETRRKLSKYASRYKLIVRTSQEPSDEKGNVFLFTSERANEYQYFRDIDFLVIDEFYKLSSKRDDERSDSLNNAFKYLLERYKPQFYLLGPNIESISSGFAERFNAVFYKTDYSLVACDEVNIYEQHKDLFGTRGAKKLYKENVLFELLQDLRGQSTIIYCSSPGRARYLASEYSKFLDLKGVALKRENLPIIDWIERYVSPDWGLIKWLQHGIGVHDGGLQRHITTTVIDYFNNKNLDVLFCTATIIEGVNTTAKNVIFFDNKKGLDKDIDFFDYSNIKGRAGRLMEHYIGMIYNFNQPPPRDVVYVDIPFFEQNPISDEVLINIEDEDVLSRDSDQYKYLSSLPFAEKELFRKNGLYIRGQASLVEKLRADLEQNYELLFWEATPTYPQLSYCLGLAWDYLVKPGELQRPMTKDRIVKVTFDYGFNKSINDLVANILKYKRSVSVNVPDQELVDDAIRDAFQILRHWFQYKIPKWLLVVNELQRFVCSEKGLRPGNYTFYASSIECDFIRENMAILAEYGIPKSAIEKLEKYIGKDLSQERVMEEIMARKYYDNPEFIDYEKHKIIENWTLNT